MRKLIRRISDAGITVLLVEHNMGLVMEVSDRILVIDYGSRWPKDHPRRFKQSQSDRAYLGGEIEYAV